jgi:hypothetical protein
MREAKRIQQSKKLKRVGGKAKTSNRLQPKPKQNGKSWQTRNELRKPLQEAYERYRANLEEQQAEVVE